MAIKKQNNTMIFTEIETYNNGTIANEYLINKKSVDEHTFYTLKYDQFDKIKYNKLKDFKQNNIKSETTNKPKPDENTESYKTIKDIALDPKNSKKIDENLSDFVDELFEGSKIEAKERLSDFLEIVMNSEYYFGYLDAFMTQRDNLNIIINKLKKS